MRENPRMAPEIVAVVSAAVSLLGAVIAGWMTAWSARRTLRYEALIKGQQKDESKAEQAEAILSLYREPLLRAAHNLQSRLYNVVDMRFLATYLHCGDSELQRYARDHTVYVLAEYLCWVEIVRRDLRFLDLGTDPRNQKFVELIDISQRVLTHEAMPRPWRLFRGQQRAIGELTMITAEITDAARHESLGYVEYCTRLEQDPDFAGWFSRLRSDVDDLATAERDEQVRLITLQHKLMDLIEFLDPDKLRLPAKYRDRLAPAGKRTITAR